MRPATFCLALFVILLAALPRPAFATQAVVLVWDPSPSPHIISYNVRFGIHSGSYTSKVRCGPVTTTTISNLLEGQTYYFVVTAANSAGAQSAPSNEAVYTAPGIAPPGTPTIVRVGATAILKWNPSPSPNASGYNVYFGPTRTSITQLFFSGYATQIDVSQSGYYVASAFNSSTWEQSLPTAPVQFTASVSAAEDPTTVVPRGPVPPGKAPPRGKVTASDTLGDNSVQPPLNQAALTLGARPHSATDENETNSPARGASPAATPVPLQLEFDSAARLRTNGLTFTLHRANTLAGHIEYSTDLVTWTRWTDFGAGDSPITFLDPDTVRSPRRFYRAVIP